MFVHAAGGFDGDRLLFGKGVAEEVAITLALISSMRELLELDEGISRLPLISRYFLNIVGMTGRNRCDRTK